MQQQGALDDRSRCKLCAKPVGERPHVCSSPLVCSFVADFSALYEPWHGLGQEEFAGLRRLQGQVVVVMPEAAHFEQPAEALQSGELMLFQVPSCLVWFCVHVFIAHLQCWGCSWLPGGPGVPLHGACASALIAVVVTATLGLT